METGWKSDIQAVDQCGDYPRPDVRCQGLMALESSPAPSRMMNRGGPCAACRPLLDFIVDCRTFMYHGLNSTRWMARVPEASQPPSRKLDRRSIDRTISEGLLQKAHRRRHLDDLAPLDRGDRRTHYQTGRFVLSRLPSVKRSSGDQDRNLLRDRCQGA